jgi:hypothetical protein
MSELLILEGEVLDVTSGRFLITGLSLPLAETSTAGLLVVTAPLYGMPELLDP